MVETRREGFDENFPTARSLAKEISEVFSEDMRSAIAKKAEKKQYYENKTTVQ